MRILFVDDMSERHDSFGRQLLLLNETTVDYDVWYAWTGEEAQKLIETHDFDVMFLDHDLGDDQYREHISGQRGQSKSLSGTELAWQVRELPEARQPKLSVVHSWNRYGAARMVDAILKSPGHGRVIQLPFSDDLVKAVLPFLPIEK